MSTHNGLGVLRSRPDSCVRCQTLLRVRCAVGLAPVSTDHTGFASRHGATYVYQACRVKRWHLAGQRTMLCVCQWILFGTLLSIVKCGAASSVW